MFLFLFVKYLGIELLSYIVSIYYTLSEIFFHKSDTILNPH